MVDIKKLDIRMLFLIASPKIAQKAEKLLEKLKVPVQYNTIAHGTASSEFVDMLGLGGTDKSVITAFLPKIVADDILKSLQHNLYLGAPNTGVAFTIAITGATSRIIKQLSVYDDSTLTERKRDEKMENSYSMIMAFVNQGYSEEVMSAARPAGANGGTVFHSRCVGNENSFHLFGISVQEEREIVLILAESEKKKDIMKAIVDKCGANTDADGMVVSIPVDSVEGIYKD